MVEEWQFISEYPTREYRCGLKAGDKIQLRKDIIVRDHKGHPTGKVYPQGEIWSVLPGAKENVVWLLQADGERHTWDDDNTIHEDFDTVAKDD